MRISEGLTDGEMEPPPALARLPVDEETRNGIQLPPDIEPDGTDRGLVPKPRTDRVSKIVERLIVRPLPHVARVHEQDAAKVAVQHRPDFFAPREHAVAADRQSR